MMGSENGFLIFILCLVLTIAVLEGFKSGPEPIACPVIESTICNLIHAIDDDCDGIDFLNQTDGPNYDYKCKNVNYFRHINIREGMR